MSQLGSVRRSLSAITPPSARARCASRTQVLCVSAAAAEGGATAQASLMLGRRQVFGAAAAAAIARLAWGCGLGAVGAATVPSPPASALELAPLGAVERVGGEKLVGLKPEEVADILARNLREGQYFITGDLTPEVFADDCRFKDPTNETQGLSRYMKALGLLFDASYSAVQLEGIRVTSPTTIEADWKLGGYLRFPWHPRVEPFKGHTVYTLGPDGLITLQDQTWSISSATALIESFTPTGGVSTDIKQSMGA